MDEEDEYSPSEFYYPEDLDRSNVETVTDIGESQEAIAIDELINKQNKRTATDMKTLLQYLEGNGMRNERVETPY